MLAVLSDLIKLPPQTQHDIQNLQLEFDEASLVPQRPTPAVVTSKISLTPFHVQINISNDEMQVWDLGWRYAEYPSRTQLFERAEPLPFGEYFQSMLQQQGSDVAARFEKS